MIVLQPKTRVQLNNYMQQVARLNGAENCSVPFAVKPSIEQRLVSRYALQTDFLGMINMMTVSQAHGQKLGLGLNKTAASTTDTRIQPRRPTVLTDMEGIDDYLCTKTNYDIALDWNILDAWGHMPDFQTRAANLSITTIAQDKQRIGFNGTHRAKTSNRQLHPLLQDVNKGWLQKIRDNAPERHMNGLKVGADQYIKNLDALVEMAKHEMIDEQHRQGNDLVAICSTSMATDKYIGLLNQTQAPTEQQAANNLYMRKQFGTSQVYTPSFFIPNGVLVTSLDNLSIYMQSNTMRRCIKDEPEWDRTTDYQSVNECFVVEDYTKVAFFENIEMV